MKCVVAEPADLWSNAPRETAYKARAPILYFRRYLIYPDISLLSFLGLFEDMSTKNLDQDDYILNRDYRSIIR